MYAHCVQSSVCCPEAPLLDLLCRREGIEQKDNSAWQELEVLTTGRTRTFGGLHVREELLVTRYNTGVVIVPSVTSPDDLNRLCWAFLLVFMQNANPFYPNNAIAIAVLLQKS